jgi:hypothetical protein
MINSFGDELFVWDDVDEATSEMCLNIRYGMCASALMTYAAMVAAQEVAELNELYAEDEH